MNLRIILTVIYQFLETGTLDRCIICIVQRLRFSGFILYPLSFFHYCPFKNGPSLSPGDKVCVGWVCYLYSLTKQIDKDNAQLFMTNSHVDNKKTNKLSKNTKKIFK